MSQRFCLEHKACGMTSLKKEYFTLGVFCHFACYWQNTVNSGDAVVTNVLLRFTDVI